MSAIRLRAARALISAVLAALAVGVAVAQRPSSIKIPFETYTLPNGLTVIPQSIGRRRPLP